MVSPQEVTGLLLQDPPRLSYPSHSVYEYNFICDSMFEGYELLLNDWELPIN
jgi:hypothetical protein